MSVLLLYSGETSFFVAMIRAIIVRVLPYEWYEKPKIFDRIKDNTKPILSPHKAPRPSTGGAS